MKASLGERVFLFLYALVTNAADWVVDVSLDLVDQYTGQRRKRLKTKEQYFDRLKRQMGVGTTDIESKTTSLEDELMNLQKEMANLAIVIPSLPPPPPPPPPPLTQLDSLTTPSKSSNTSVRAVDDENNQTRRKTSQIHPPSSTQMYPSTRGTMSTVSSTTQRFETIEKACNPSSSLIEELKRKPILKPVKKSVGTTKKKREKENDFNFQNDLFAAIQKKFKMVHRAEADDDNTGSNESTPIKKISNSSFGSVGIESASNLMPVDPETEKACENLKNIFQDSFI
jgi:hypothetical protein